MKNKSLIVILVIVALIIGMVLVGIWIKQKPISPKERFEKRSQEFKKLYEEKLSQGYNLTEVEDLLKKAKQAYERDDYESANELLDKAFVAIKNAKKIPALPTPPVSKWTNETYTQFYFQNSIDLEIPSLTKEQLQQAIQANKKSLLDRLNNMQIIYKKRTQKYESSSVLNEEDKRRAKEVMDNILNDISQLRQDLTLNANIDQIYNEYNKLRKSVIDEIPLQQELRKKYYEQGYEVFIAKYTPKEYHKMKFGVLADSGSPFSWYTGYKDPGEISVDYIFKEIDLLNETGIDIIMIYIVYDPWLDNDIEAISKIDRIVERIRANNKKVYIGLSGVAKWFGPIPTVSIGEGKVNFETLKETYLSMTETIVKRYDPDYLAIVEPTIVLASQVNEIKSPEDWVDLTRRAADKAKEGSPDTLVTVHTIPGDLGDFFSGVMDLENIDIVGVDVYSIGVVRSINYLLPYWNKEKEFWITEAWDGGVYLDSLTEKYIIASVYYAQSNNMTGYNLYYGQYLHTKDFEKTPAFYTYKSLIEEVRNNLK